MNVLYPSFKDLLLTGAFDWVNDSVSLLLYDKNVVYRPTDTTASQLAGTRVAQSASITGKQVQDGLAISDAVRYTHLSSPVEAHAAVLVRTTDDRLIAFMDQINGFNFQPTGGDYILTPGGPNMAYFQL